jgi:hypothetical protein
MAGAGSGPTRQDFFEVREISADEDVNNATIIRAFGKALIGQVHCRMGRRSWCWEGFCHAWQSTGRDRVIDRVFYRTLDVDFVQVRNLSRHLAVVATWARYAYIVLGLLEERAPINRDNVPRVTAGPGTFWHRTHILVFSGTRVGVE